MAFVAGLCPGAAWGNRQYRMQLLLAPAVALQRCWQDSDSMFACITDWQAQVRTGVHGGMWLEKREGGRHCRARRCRPLQLACVAVPISNSVDSAGPHPFCLQPIELRRPFCFYYGHVAAFTKVRLCPGQAPSELDAILSRGMDPLVLDPSQCHSHPPAPPAWPSRRELEAYAAAVRQQALAAVCRGDDSTGDDSTGGDITGGVSTGGFGMHAVCMVLEHERLHQETLCYMLAQQRKADAAAGTSGQPAILTTSSSGSPQLQAAGGPGVGQPDIVPFYLQQCSYANTSLAPDSAPDSAGQQPSLLVPATPSKAADLPRHRLGAAPGSSHSPPAVTADSTAGFVLIPGGQVRV